MTGEQGEPGPYTVEFVRDDGTVQTVEATGTQSVLELADRNSIDIRQGCREGRCVSCTGRILSGEIRYVTEPHALTDRLRKSGFVLLCVAIPTSDCRFEIGQSVLAAAFPGLWKSEGYTEIDALQQVRAELTRLESSGTRVSKLDHLKGALEPYDNLHRIQQAYRNVRK